MRIEQKIELNIINAQMRRGDKLLIAELCDYSYEYIVAIMNCKQEAPDRLIDLIIRVSKMYLANRAKLHDNVKKLQKSKK